MKNQTLLRCQSVLLLFVFLRCQSPTQSPMPDLAGPVAGAYRVSELEVFDQRLDASRDYTGLVTLTKTDASHVRLGIDIHRKTDEPAPVETLCALRQTQHQTQLIEVTTQAVLGYVERREIHLHSLDSNGSKTTVMGQR